MAPSSKSKSKSISASSFLELKAELAKKEEELTKLKAAGQSTTIAGGPKRPDKKPTVWTRQNKGVSSRAARDLELEAIDKPTLESARAVLERKAKIYDKLMKGKTGGLSENQYASLLVDFDSKPIDGYESDSDDVDESLTVPKAPPPEVQACCRVYVTHKSTLQSMMKMRNPVNHFPVYTPSQDRIAEIDKTFAEENNPLNVHFNADKDNRAMGAGFYQFSADEETRRAQMEELKAARDETMKVRQDTGAVDIKAGEIEGMRASESARSRAMEKRKREIEERRALIEAKRKKIKDEATREQETPPAAEPVTGLVQPSQSAGDSTAGPFAAFEVQATRPRKDKTKSNAPTEADTFLAQLERDLLASGKK